jgi:hypothetical protein
MIDANTKDKDKEHITCPFSKLKSTTKLKSTKLKSTKLKNSKNSKKTPCPIVNALINAGELDPNREWTMKEVGNVLTENKLTSDMFSKVFAFLVSFPNLLSFPPTFKPLSLSVKTLQQHNTAIEHDVSISREDYNLGDHIHYSDKRFKLIYKYFKDQKSITLKELIEYVHYLYKKSKKENSKFNFKLKQWFSVLVEIVIIFTLLSENDHLNLKKLEKVFKKESLEGVKINTITTVNYNINIIKAIHFWTIATVMN